MLDMIWTKDAGGRLVVTWVQIPTRRTTKRTGVSEMRFDAAIRLFSRLRRGKRIELDAAEIPDAAAAEDA